MQGSEPTTIVLGLGSLVATVEIETIKKIKSSGSLRQSGPRITSWCIRGQDGVFFKFIYIALVHFLCSTLYPNERQRGTRPGVALLVVFFLSRKHINAKYVGWLEDDDAMTISP